MVSPNTKTGSASGQTVAFASKGGVQDKVSGGVFDKLKAEIFLAKNPPAKSNATPVLLPNLKMPILSDPTKGATFIPSGTHPFITGDQSKRGYYLPASNGQPYKPNSVGFETSKSKDGVAKTTIIINGQVFATVETHKTGNKLLDKANNIATGLYTGGLIFGVEAFVGASNALPAAGKAGNYAVQYTNTQLRDAQAKPLQVIKTLVNDGANSVAGIISAIVHIPTNIISNFIDNYQKMVPTHGSVQALTAAFTKSGLDTYTTFQGAKTILDISKGLSKLPKSKAPSPSVNDPVNHRLRANGINAKGQKRLPPARTNTPPKMLAPAQASSTKVTYSDASVTPQQIWENQAGAGVPNTKPSVKKPAAPKQASSPVPATPEQVSLSTANLNPKHPISQARFVSEAFTKGDALTKTPAGLRQAQSVIDAAEKARAKGNIGSFDAKTANEIVAHLKAQLKQAKANLAQSNSSSPSHSIADQNVVDANNGGFQPQGNPRQRAYHQPQQADGGDGMGGKRAQPQPPPQAPEFAEPPEVKQTGLDVEPKPAIEKKTVVATTEDGSSGNNAGKVSKTKKPKPDALDKKIKQWQKENPDEALMNAIFGVSHEAIKAQMLSNPSLTVEEAIAQTGSKQPAQTAQKAKTEVVKFGDVSVQNGVIIVDEKPEIHGENKAKMLKMLMNANGKEISLEAITDHLYGEGSSYNIMTEMNTRHVISDTMQALGDKNIIEEIVNEDGYSSYKLSKNAKKHVPTEFNPETYYDGYDESLGFDDLECGDLNISENSVMIMDHNYNTTCPKLEPNQIKALKALVKKDGASVSINTICDELFGANSSNKTTNIKKTKLILDGIIKSLGKDNVVETLDNGKTYAAIPDLKHKLNNTVGLITQDKLVKDFGFTQAAAKKFEADFKKLKAEDQRLFETLLRIKPEGITKAQRGKVLKHVLNLMKDDYAIKDVRLALRRGVDFAVEDMVFAGGMYRKPFMSHERGTVVIDKFQITAAAYKLEDTTESIIAHELTHLRFDKLTNAQKYYPSAKDFPPRQDKAKALQDYIDAYSAKRIEEEVYAFRAGFRNAQNNHPTRAIPCEDALYEAYGRSFSGRLTPEMIKKVGQILLDSRGYKQDYADAATQLYNMHWNRQ